MKKLLLPIGLIVFLTLSLVNADEISDFQIEGISVGDSALNYFSEKEIKKGIRKGNNPYTDKSFIRVILFKHKILEIYDAISFHIKKNDSKYIIYALGGLKDFINQPEKCENLKELIYKNLNEMFPFAEKSSFKNNMLQDKSNKSKVSTSQYIFDNGDKIRIQCYDFSKEMKHKDHLNVSINLAEFIDWLINKAYK